MNELKSLSQAYMQNGGGMSSIMDIFMTKDPDSLKRKIQQYEEEMQQQQRQSEERQLQAQQQQVDAQLQIEASRQEHERMLKEMEINSAEYIKMLELQSSGNEDNSGEIEKLKIQREKIKQDAMLKEKQLQETVRHNKVSEEISRIKKKTTNK
jgi:multidrug efflux pump subunit AcrA (membrane-fusion protein)